MLSSCCVHDPLLFVAGQGQEYGLPPQGWQQSISPEPPRKRKATLPFATAVDAAAGAAHGVFFNLTNSTQAPLEVDELELCSFSGAPCELALYAVSSGDPCIGLEDYEEEWTLAGAVDVSEDLSAVCLRLRAPVSIRPKSSCGFYLHTRGGNTARDDTRGDSCGIGGPLRLILPARRKHGSVGLSIESAADSALIVEPWLLSLSETPFSSITESSKRTPAGKIIYRMEGAQTYVLSSELQGPDLQSNSASNFLPCCAAEFRGADEQEAAWTSVPGTDRAFRAV